MTRVFNGLWNPLAELSRVQRDLNCLIPAGWRSLAAPATSQPAANIWQDENQVTLTLEVPGIDPENIDVTVTEEAVTLRIRRAERELAEGESWVRRERHAGEIGRTITLPCEVDPEKTDATYQHGILTLTLQRPEAHKPHKVKVKAC